MKHKLFCVANATIPLAVGAFLYYLVDPSVIFVKWIDSILSYSYHYDFSTYNQFCTILRNYLFDALWSYSLLFSIYLLIDRKNRLFWSISVSFVVGILLESLQLLDKVPGTFDLIDIFTQFLSVVFASIIICLERRFVNEEIC